MITSLEYKLRLKHCSEHNLQKFLSKNVLFKDRHMMDKPDHDDEEHSEGEHKNSDYWFVMTSDAPDREGDCIFQAGIDTDFLMKHGSVLWGHRADHPDYVLGRVSDILKEEHRTLVNVRFADAEANPYAARVRKMIDQRIVSGMSIGFMLKEFSEVTDREGMMPLDIWRCEAVETSITPVPMNVQAVMERHFDGEEKKDLIETIERTVEETPAGAQSDVSDAAATVLKELNNNRVYSIPDSAYQEIARMCVQTLMDID